MTLDEAIMRFKSNAEYEREHGSPVCLKSKQLCKWLKELRAYRKMYHKDHANDYLRDYESKCKWIKYDYRTICPQNHDIDNPYWRIPESRMDALKYCPYCGKEIEVTE